MATGCGSKAVASLFIALAHGTGRRAVLLLTQRTWGNVQMMTDGCIRHPNEKPPSFLVFG